LNLNNDGFIASLPGKDAWTGKYVQVLRQGCRLNCENGGAVFYSYDNWTLMNF